MGQRGGEECAVCRRRLLAAVAGGGPSPPSVAVPVVPGTSSPLRAGRLQGSILPCSDPQAPALEPGHSQRVFLSSLPM